MTTEEVLPNPRFPSAEECVLEHLLRQRAAAHPDRVFAVFFDGTTWTFREALQEACRAAAALQRLGIRKGDTVLSWLPNGADALRVWFGSGLLGAIFTPVNVAYRGGLLEHVIDNSGAHVLVAHADLVERLDGLSLGDLRSVVIVGGDAPGPASLAHHDGAILRTGDGAYTPPSSAVEPWDAYAIIYTSGTTGPSKGVVSTYIHLYEGVRVAYLGCGVTGDDRYMLQVPLFHLGGIIGTFAMLIAGGCIVMLPSFDTQSFWTIVRDHRITVCTLLGAMATFLAKQHAVPEDASNPLRLVYMVPLLGDVPGFARRFGVDIYTMFSMTETSCPIISELNSTVDGSCGRLRQGLEARIVDDYDREVAGGDVGELMLRAALPWSQAAAYHRAPEATARAWRNGWFHTGDAFRQDGNGNFYFVDRIKDYIRRRGENISSFELEREVLFYPQVREAAAVAVVSDFSEDEVLVAVAPRPGERIDPAELISFLIPRLPHFMVPRYVRVVDELPKTATSKVVKHLIREAGITADTWDREAAGIRIKRTAIGEGR